MTLTLWVDIPCIAFGLWGLAVGLTTRKTIGRLIDANEVLESKLAQAQRKIKILLIRRGEL